MMPGMQVTDAGEMAIFADPTGAAFSVWKAGEHIGAELANEPDAYERAVLEEFDVPASELHSRRRTRSVVLPRQICMYLARLHTTLSLAEIGRFFGGRDHSTVLHAVEKVQELVASGISRTQLGSTLWARMRGRDYSQVVLRDGGETRVVANPGQEAALDWLANEQSRATDAD